MNPLHSVREPDHIQCSPFIILYLVSTEMNHVIKGQLYKEIAVKSTYSFHGKKFWEPQLVRVETKSQHV